MKNQEMLVKGYEENEEYQAAIDQAIKASKQEMLVKENEENEEDQAAINQAIKASLQDQELQQVPKIPNVLTDRKFRDKLKRRLGFNLKEMKSDGNCLFRSLAEFTNEGEGAFSNIRNLIYH